MEDLREIQKEQKRKEKYIPYQCPSRRPDGGGAIVRAQRPRSQRPGGFHRELEGWPGSWDQRRRCLYPPYLRLTVSETLIPGRRVRERGSTQWGAKLTMAMRTSRASWFWRRQMRTLLGSGVHHEQEALLGSRELRDVVVRMRTSDVLLHGAIAFFLGAWLATSKAFDLDDLNRIHAGQFSRRRIFPTAVRRDGNKVGLERRCSGGEWRRRKTRRQSELTPVHRLRQLERS
jgi:hypothetical protein